ncbi:MAG TPA: YafY family protein [Opitutaceae bacterium]
MNRTDRLVAMVMFLQGRRVVRAEELAAHFEISVRTVYRDLGALAEAGVPLIGEAGVGYTLVKGYHLPPVMFTADEAMALAVGENLVKQFTDRSLAAPMALALLKIRSVLPRERQDDLDRLARSTAIEGRARLPSGLDQKILLPIQQAIVARRLLRMTYRARAAAEDTQREVEPLGVTYYGDAWYLVAWCRLRQAYRHFKVERLRALEVLTERFEMRPDFSLSDHLASSMSHEDKIPVRLWFSEDVLERARRESYTPFVDEQPVRDGLELTLHTYSLAWLARWVLSFGERAEVIDPPELKQMVIEEAQRVLEKYGAVVS